MKRSQPPRRTSPLRRVTSALKRLVRPQPVNRKRRAKENERAYGIETGKVAYVVSLPCCVCGYSAAPSDPAHAKGGGGSRKSDARFLVPLCKPHWALVPRVGYRTVEGCHEESHRGIKTFQATHGVDLLAMAERVEAEWQAYAQANGRTTETGEVA